MHMVKRYLLAALASIVVATAIFTGCKDKDTAPTGKAGGPDILSQTRVLEDLDGLKDIDGQGMSGELASVANVYFSGTGRSAACVLNTSKGLQVLYKKRLSGPFEALDTIRLSPDGDRIAYAAMITGKWQAIIDGEVGVRSDQASVPVFSPDGRHTAYTAKSGGKWFMVVDRQKSAAGRAFLGDPMFSGDSSRIVHAEKESAKGPFRLVVSDLRHQRLIVRESCGRTITGNRDKTMLAALCETETKQSVITMRFEHADAIYEGALYDEVSHIAWGNDGASLAYLGTRGKDRYLVVNHAEHVLPDGHAPGLPVVRPDGKGAGILVSAPAGYYLHETFRRNSAPDKAYDEAEGLVYDERGGYAFAARRGGNWFVVANHGEGPTYDRVVTPIFTPDGTKVVYRARKDGKRFVVIADVKGKTIRQHSSYEQVFQPVFTSDGKSVAYGVKDGNRLVWKVEKL